MDYRTTYEPVAVTEAPAPPAADPAPGGLTGRGRRREVLETALLTVVIFFVVNYTTGRYRIDGDSMEPTMHNREYVIINKVSYKIGQPQRGDIIVFEYPRSPDRDFIKRIIGLPGDTVDIRNGAVFVNGAKLTEVYIADAPLYSSTWTVEPAQYFVLGDNRNNSSDSHSWGLLPAENIIGKAWVTYWPITDWGIVPHVAYDNVPDPSP